MLNSVFYLFLVTCFGFFPSIADPRTNPDAVVSQSQSTDQKALLALKEALKKYHLKSTQIKIEQEIFLFPINTSMKSQGMLSLKNGKFYLSLYGNPASIMLFDGKFLWYQADISEKIVFCLKEHPQIQILSGLFSEESFLNTFSIKKSVQKNREYFLQLLPKKHIEGLSEIFMGIGTYIFEIRIIWKDLNSWQKYTLSKPLYKALPDRHFQFSTTGFQVITKKTLQQR